MKKLFALLIILSSCNDHSYKTDKGEICSNILKERSAARFNNQYLMLPAIDSLFLKCGCDSLK